MIPDNPEVRITESIRAALAKVKDQINPELYNNPQFIAQIHNIVKTMDSFDSNHYIKIDIAVRNDGNLVSVYNQFKNFYGQLYEGKGFSSTTLELSSDCLVVNNKIEHEKKIDPMRYDENKYFMENINRAVKNGTDKRLLNAFYSQQVFDSNGIQLSYSKYEDLIPVQCGMAEEGSHLLKCYDPVFNYRYPPTHSKYSFNAHSKHYARNYDNLAVWENTNINQKNEITLSRLPVISYEQPTIFDSNRTPSLPLAVFSDGKWIPNKEFQKWCGELEPSVYESENELEICDSYALIFEKKLKEIEKEKEKYNYSQDPSSIALRKIVEENNQKRFNEQISEEKHR